MHSSNFSCLIHKQLRVLETHITALRVISIDVTVYIILSNNSWRSVKSVQKTQKRSFLLHNVELLTSFPKWQVDDVTDIRVYFLFPFAFIIVQTVTQTGIFRYKFT